MNLFFPQGFQMMCDTDNAFGAIGSVSLSINLLTIDHDCLSSQKVCEMLNDEFSKVPIFLLAKSEDHLSSNPLSLDSAKRYRRARSAAVTFAVTSQVFLVLVLVLVLLVLVLLLLLLDAEI